MIRRGYRALSLRTRLTLLVVILLALAGAAVGGAGAFAVASYLTGRLDQQLELAGGRYAVALENNDHDADNSGNLAPPGSPGSPSGPPGRGGPGSAETATVGQPVGTLGARSVGGVVTAVGVVAEPGAPVTTVSAAARDVLGRLRPGSGNQVVQLPGLGEYRVRIAPGLDGDVLITGLPTGPVHDAIRDVLLVDALVFLGVLVVAGVVGGLAVKRSLRPLTAVTTTALQVAERPLDTGDGSFPERVPAGDRRTEVGQVAAAVNHLLGRVQAALMARQASEDQLRRFVADASHELRTPLAVVRSHTDLLVGMADDGDQSWPESAAESLRSITSGTARMGRLVDDLLLLARLDDGVPLDRQRVDLTRTAVEAVADIRVTATTHHWRLDLPAEPVIVTGDEQRLHQVLHNLLANAAAHTPAGTVVTLTLRRRPAAVDPGPDLDSVELSVTDDGPGIAAELLPRVTQRFVRGGTGRSGEPGHPGSTGLGLAIAESVARAHHGTLRVESRPGRTRVSVTLPAADPREPADDSRPAGDSGRNGVARADIGRVTRDRVVQ